GPGARARGQRRDRDDDATVADALRRSRHAARAGRQGGDRRAGARGDRPGPEGGRARHDRERRELGRPEVPAAVQGGRSHARRTIPRPPSSYQRRLYYDTVVGSEKALRFLLDEVGVDRVVLGSDWPFVPWHPSPVAWVQGLKSLTADEKEKILWKNLEALLG